jgi:hypothetical protein
MSRKLDIPNKAVYHVKHTLLGDHVLHENRITRTHLRELFPAPALYTVPLAAIKCGRPMYPGVRRSIVLASPMQLPGR